MPQFTVLIPSYNRGALIGRTLDSVFAQRFTDFEVIVVDDGSTDDTPAVLAAFGDRVRVLHQPNRGPGAARSLGIANAAGRYVAFLDSDDLWFPWTLATYQACIERFDAPAWISGDGIPFVDESELQNPPEASRAPSAEAFPDYYAASGRDTWLPLCAIAARTDALRDVGGFTDQWINAEDTDLWMRLGTAPGFVLVTSPPLFGYRQHTNNASRVTDRAIAGMRFLLSQEESGRYPGGPARARERHRILGRHLRPTSLRFLREGHAGAAWEIYRRSLGWHLREGRLKYLLGFPALAAWGRRR